MIVYSTKHLKLKAPYALKEQQPIQPQLIYQYDKYTLELIATYRTQTEAHKTTWLDVSNITKNINGKLKSTWWFIFTKTPIIQW